jgi:hypothetical protein
LRIPSDGLVDPVKGPEVSLQVGGGGPHPDESLKALQGKQNVGGRIAVAAELEFSGRRNGLQISDALSNGLLKALKVEIVGKIRISGGVDTNQRRCGLCRWWCGRRLRGCLAADQPKYRQNC